jgi:hypothetical protein
MTEFLSDEVRNFEPSGLTGLGELYALIQLISRLSQIHLPWDLAITTHSQSSPDMLSENLIILGGPDVNTAALAVQDALRDRLSVKVQLDADAKTPWLTPWKERVIDPPSAQ